MDQNLISKKELLELTGISYGQLYRWKRKNLIPEHWFIRKSTYTGQETFFPRDQILARIEQIKNMKEDLSLDEIANLLSPTPSQISLKKEELLKRNIVSKTSLDLYTKHKGEHETYSFERILTIYILDQFLKAGEMSLEESAILLDLLENHDVNLQEQQAELIFLRKMGIATVLLSVGGNRIYFEPGVRIVSRGSLNKWAEELKLKLSEWRDMQCEIS
jgi:DNA-binding transcriptional MerR regulator